MRSVSYPPPSSHLSPFFIPSLLLARKGITNGMFAAFLLDLKSARIGAPAGITFCL